jgi:hypothetical protein
VVPTARSPRVAAEIAAAEGGTTLEMALNRANILMPDGDSGDAGRAIWVHASTMFAQRAIGSVRVVRGETFSHPRGHEPLHDLRSIRRGPADLFPRHRHGRTRRGRRPEHHFTGRPPIRGAGQSL